MELKDFKERFVFIKCGNAKFYKKLIFFWGPFNSFCLIIVYLNFIFFIDLFF